MPLGLEVEGLVPGGLCASDDEFLAGASSLLDDKTKGAVVDCNSGPVCELCKLESSAVYCKNDKAFLCANCDAKVHSSNPLAARHEIVSVAAWHQEQAESLGGVFCPEIEVKTESGMESQGSGSCGRLGGSAFSLPSSEQTLIGAQSDGSTDNALSNLPVLDLLAGVPDFTDDSQTFDDIKLDACWIDELENKHKPKESLQDQDSEEEQTKSPTLAAEWTPPQVSCGPQMSPWAAFGTYDPSTYFYGAQAPFLAPFLPAAASCTPVATGFPVSSTQPTAQERLDRKARVARYLEKRKHRTWENKIRYASRKAYAENRPRIKGRFARPEEVEAYMQEQKKSKKPDRA